MTRPLECEDDDLGDILCRHHPGQRIGCPATALVEGEVGRDAARTDVRAADALLAQFVVERAREADLAELGGAVGRLVRKATAPGLGRQE